MDALRASYGEASSESDSESDSTHFLEPAPSCTVLPPPPLSLLTSPGFTGALGLSIQNNQPNRIRIFPHVEGNFALHIFIQVEARKELALFIKRVAALVPELHAVDIDIPLTDLMTKDEHNFEQVVLGRAFHISLGRTVPVRVHQRDSIVAMLRQRLQSRRRYWIDFKRWEVFINDDCTRTFLSMEVITGGLAELHLQWWMLWYMPASDEEHETIVDYMHLIKKQIEAVNEVYRLHNLPEFYKDPRPHISVAWASGDTSVPLKRAIGDEMTRHNSTGGLPQKKLFTCKFGGVHCKIGQKNFEICKIRED